jgi:hypothetical protein
MAENSDACEAAQAHRDLQDRKTTGSGLLCDRGLLARHHEPGARPPVVELLPGSDGALRQIDRTKPNSTTRHPALPRMAATVCAI